MAYNIRDRQDDQRTLFILPLLYDYLLLCLVSELEILSLVPSLRSFLVQQEQCKYNLVEMRMVEQKAQRKTDGEKKRKQTPDVQTKPADASSP